MDTVKGEDAIVSIRVPIFGHHLGPVHLQVRRMVVEPQHEQRRIGERKRIVEKENPRFRLEPKLGSAKLRNQRPNQPIFKIDLSQWSRAMKPQ